MAKIPTPSAASGDEDRRLDQIGEAFRRSASLDLENEAPDDWKAYLTIVQSRIKAQSPGYGTLSGRSLADHILPTLRALAVVYAADTAPVPFSAFLAEELAGRSSTWRLEEEDAVLETIGQTFRAAVSAGKTPRTACVRETALYLAIVWLRIEYGVSGYRMYAGKKMAQLRPYLLEMADRYAGSTDDVSLPVFLKKNTSHRYDDTARTQFEDDDRLDAIGAAFRRTAAAGSRLSRGCPSEWFLYLALVSLRIDKKYFGYKAYAGAASSTVSADFSALAKAYASGTDPMPFSDYLNEALLQQYADALPEDASLAQCEEIFWYLQRLTGREVLREDPSFLERLAKISSVSYSYQETRQDKDDSAPSFDPDAFDDGESMASDQMDLDSETPEPAPAEPEEDEMQDGLLSAAALSADAAGSDDDTFWKDLSRALRTRFWENAARFPHQQAQLRERYAQLEAKGTFYANWAINALARLSCRTEDVICRNRCHHAIYHLMRADDPNAPHADEKISCIGDAFKRFEPYRGEFITAYFIARRELRRRNDPNADESHLYLSMDSKFETMLDNIGMPSFDAARADLIDTMTKYVKGLERYYDKANDCFYDPASEQGIAEVIDLFVTVQTAAQAKIAGAPFSEGDRFRAPELLGFSGYTPSCPYRFIAYFRVEYDYRYMRASVDRKNALDPSRNKTACVYAKLSKFAPKSQRVGSLEEQKERSGVDIADTNTDTYEQAMRRIEGDRQAELWWAVLTSLDYLCEVMIVIRACTAASSTKHDFFPRFFTVDVAELADGSILGEYSNKSARMELAKRVRPYLELESKAALYEDIIDGQFVNFYTDCELDENEYLTIPESVAFGYRKRGSFALSKIKDPALAELPCAFWMQWYVLREYMSGPRFHGGKFKELKKNNFSSKKEQYRNYLIRLFNLLPHRLDLLKTDPLNVPDEIRDLPTSEGAQHEAHHYDDSVPMAVDLLGRTILEKYDRFGQSKPSKEKGA